MQWFPRRRQKKQTMPQEGAQGSHLRGNKKQMEQEGPYLEIPPRMRVQCDGDPRRQPPREAQVQLPLPRLSRSQVLPHTLSRLSV